VEELLFASADSKNGYLKLLENKDKQIEKLSLDLRTHQDRDISRSFHQSFVDQSYERPIQQSTPLYPYL
jgi:hypothetical protein